MAQRVDHQIERYDKMSQAAQKKFRRLRQAKITCAASIPLLVAFANSHQLAPTIIGMVGAIVVVLAAFQSLGQHHENGVEYRTTCESLKHEKYLFLIATEPYEIDNPYPLFVQRIESLISKENSAWSQHTRVAGNKSRISSA